MLYVYWWFEGLALVLLSAGLLGADWNARRVAVAATIMFVGVYVAHISPMGMAGHSITGIVLLALLLNRLFAQRLGGGLVAAGIAFLLLVLFETLTTALLFGIGGTAPEVRVWRWQWASNIVVLLGAALLCRSRTIRLLQ